MINSEFEKSIDPDNYRDVCDLKYLIEMTNGKKHLIKEIIDVFLKQVPEELQSINDGITKTDYAKIKSFAHTMRSSVSIMGISILEPVLREMEELGATATSPDSSRDEKIKVLNHKLNLICRQAIEEIETKKLNYV